VEELKRTCPKARMYVKEVSYPNYLCSNSGKTNLGKPKKKKNRQAIFDFSFSLLISR
jgi:hypothetical protein